MSNKHAEPVAVDGTIDEHGRVRVRRVRLNGHWLPVEQGRQGEDEDGRYVLVMVAGGPVRWLRLDRETLRWQLSSSARDLHHEIV